MVRVYVETYGCTLNQADSDIMKAMLSQKHELVDTEEESDVIVINTCTVKGTTENKIISRILSLEKSFVVAGCMAEERIRQFAPYAPIVGTSSLRSICKAVTDAFEGQATTYNTHESKEDLPKVLTAPIMRIPINEGCLSACFFCQTKLSRPFLQSYSPKKIVNWMNESVRKGAREIQLTSMDSGAYGRDIQTDLVELLEMIAGDDSKDRAEEEFLVRLGMINPEHAKAMLPDLIRLLSGKRFYRFLHIPVQTGSEKVCKEMGRKHTVQDYIDIAEEVRARLHGATIATDVIVGYPTETEEDFQETLSLLKKTRPEVVNISRFSPRHGTKAKELKQLPSEEVKRRSRETTLLVDGMHTEIRKNLIGRRYRVLINEKGPDFKGRNINYQQVVVKDYQGRLGEFVDVEIVDANHCSLFGKMIE